MFARPTSSRPAPPARRGTPRRRLARPSVEALEDRSLLSPLAAPFDVTGLTLSNTSVYEFRPTGTAVGTFTTAVSPRRSPQESGPPHFPPAARQSSCGAGRPASPPAPLPLCDRRAATGLSPVAG
jgi:hypothetical protein